MSDCCGGVVSETRDAAVGCPRCRTKGTAVGALAVKAILRETALGRIEREPYFFCASIDCDVVYFGGGHPFLTRDLRVEVWQKLPFGRRTVCYCFGESEASMRDEVARTGGCESVKRVRTHIAAGRCACEVRNPRGVCCLGDVTQAVKRVMATFTSTEVPLTVNAAMVQEGDRQ